MKKALFALALLACPAAAQEVLPTRTIPCDFPVPSLAEHPQKKELVIEGTPVKIRHLRSRRYRLDKNLNLVLLDRPAWGWFQATASGAYHSLCDPFGRSGTVCVGAMGPSATLETSGSDWSLSASGTLYTSGATGHAAAVRVYAGAPGSIGPVRLSAVIELADSSWSRDMFSSHGTSLGTTRSTRAGFLGLGLTVGRYDEAHVRLVILPGYWTSEYHHTVRVANFSGQQAVAKDEFALSSIRIEAGNWRISRRLTISGSLERTAAYFTKRHPNASAAVPTAQWAGTASASMRMWSLGRRNTVDVVFTSAITGHSPPLLRDGTAHLGIAWRFH